MKLTRPTHTDLPNFNLVPWRERQRRTRWRRGMQLLAALGAILSLGMLVMLTQQLSAHSDLEVLLVEVKQQQRPNTQNYDATLQQAHALYRQQQAIDQLRLQLAELSINMPADALLTEITLGANRLTLSGTAQRIQTISEVQKLLQSKTAMRVVLEEVETLETLIEHRFRIGTPLHEMIRSIEDAS